MEVKFKVRLDNINVKYEKFNLDLSGNQLMTINLKDDEIIQEYKSKNEVEQSQVLMLLLNDYIKAYADFVDNMLGEGKVDRELIEGSINSAIKEDNDGE